MELVELANSVIIFLTHGVFYSENFPTQIPDYDSHSLTLLDLFLFSGASTSAVASPPLKNSDHIISVFIDFPSNSKGDAFFHTTTNSCSITNWDSA